MAEMGPPLPGLAAGVPLSSCHFLSSLRALSRACSLESSAGGPEKPGHPLRTHRGWEMASESEPTSCTLLRGAQDVRLGGLGADRPGLGEGAATPEPLVSSLKHWPLTAKQPVGAGMNEWGKGERVGYQLRGRHRTE